MVSFTRRHRLLAGFLTKLKRQVSTRSKAHVLDPAAGAAAFLVPAAARMMKAIGSCTPAVALQNISARIRGYEIDPFAAWMGQVFIEAAILPVITAANRRPADLIAVCDSLKVETRPVLIL